MKPTITAEAFNKLPVRENHRQCPEGDYSQIKNFSFCMFDSDCVFGKHTTFHDCKFGSHSTFGEACQFYGCSFEDANDFEAGSSFHGVTSVGNYNRFKEACVFNAYARFGNLNTFYQRTKFLGTAVFGYETVYEDACVFGPSIRFGSSARFGEGCVFEFYEDKGHTTKPGYPFLALSGAGSVNRTTYFFNTTEGVIVRSGCFLGTVEEFCDKVMQDVKGDYNHPKAVEYISMAKLAVDAFKAREASRES